MHLCMREEREREREGGERGAERATAHLVEDVHPRRDPDENHGQKLVTQVRSTVARNTHTHAHAHVHVRKRTHAHARAPATSAGAASAKSMPEKKVA